MKDLISASAVSNVRERRTSLSWRMWKKQILVMLAMWDLSDRSESRYTPRSKVFYVFYFILFNSSISLKICTYIIWLGWNLNEILKKTGLCVKTHKTLKQSLQLTIYGRLNLGGIPNSSAWCIESSQENLYWFCLIKTIFRFAWKNWTYGKISR